MKAPALVAGLLASFFLVAGAWGPEPTLAAIDVNQLPAQAVAAPVPLVEEFPLPEKLRAAVTFWTRVYLEVTTKSGLLHDARHLGLVYETIRFDPRASSRARQKHIDSRRRYWRNTLRGMATGTPPKTEQEETTLRLLELELGHTPKASELRRSANQIRFQLGQRDKFRMGLIRSGAYENVMRSMFRQEGLPEDLAFLPHVESSFNLSAYSKYGAAGAWQFMRATGRRFMRVDYIVDQRLDPLIATRAAVRLLKQNYESLGSWPLAITAYNHGVSGIRRAKRKVGSSDISTIIDKYRSRSFGFASRNFYAQFLAARKIVRSYESFFGPLVRDDPEVVDEITLPFFLDVKDLERHLGVSPEVIHHYNLALRPPVFRSGKRIPRGYVLRLPAGTVGPDSEAWLAAVPGKLRHKAQRRSKYYTVRRGDTLSKIASRNRTSVSRLVGLNNLSSRHRIYPGQTLQLPEARGSRPGRSFALIKEAQAKPAPKPIAKDKIQPTSGPPQTPGGDSPFRRVEKGGYVLVDTPETLGHFADWLKIPTQRLRQLNHLSRSRKLRLGQRLKLDFSKVDRNTFIERRIEFHKGIEEDFFGAYTVTGTIDHSLRRGDNLWELSLRTYRIPAWLIQAYNRDRDLTNLIPGKTLTIPVVEPSSN